MPGSTFYLAIFSSFPDSSSVVLFFPPLRGGWSGFPLLKSLFFPSRHLVSCLPDFSDEQRIAFKVGIMPVQQHNGKPIFHHSTFDAVIVAF